MCSNEEAGSRAIGETVACTDMVARLAELAAEVAGAPGPDSGAEAMEQAEVLGSAVDRLEAAIAARVRAAEGCAAPQAVGFRSTSAWLRTALGMRAGRAAERVTLARQLPRLPRLAKQLVAGEVTFGQATAAAHAVKHLPVDDAERAEPILADLAAAGGSADDLARAGARIHEVLHPDGASEASADRGFARRWFTRTDGLDGVGYLSGVADPELNALLRARLDPLAEPAGADDDRTAAQRYADALHTLLSGGGSHHAMTVIVDLETLAGQNGEASGATGDLPAGRAGDVPAGGEPDRPGGFPTRAARRGARLADGIPIPAADARRIALNAGISRLIVGPASRPLDVGRTTRLVTPAIRVALEYRDPACVVDGCDIPAHLCEADHIAGWALGGPTSLENLALCCSFHNRYKNRHPERVQITRDPDGRVTYRIPRPGQPPPRPG